MTDALQSERILQGLSGPARECLRRLTVLPEIDSTNAFLLREPADRRHAHAVLADAQSSGRGRRQRGWHSPPGGNIYLSLGWEFDAGTAPLSTLPLATAVCLARMLEGIGLRDHGIKWPNDILVGGRKLAGILVESQSAPRSGTLAVIGIGLNVRMPEPRTGAIDRPWTDLASSLPAQASGQLRNALDRNALAAGLLDTLLCALPEFARHGFEPFREDWQRRDLLSGRRVALEGNGMARRGTALGIDDSGGLRVDIDDFGPQVLHAADVSVLDA